MNALDWFWVFANFLMPAWAMALALALLAPVLMRQGRRPRFVLNLLISGLLGTLVLVLGLVLTQNDGRMATYAALVLVQATVQWWLQRPTAA
jgi:multisubunit Na+/H+ antiporter MnhB subunit